MRVRLASTLAIAAISVGLASSIAGPIYSAVGKPGDSGAQSGRISSVVVLAGRITK
jgi:hypothetical protein